MKYTLTLKICTVIAALPLLAVGVTPLLSSEPIEPVVVREVAPTEDEAITQYKAALATIPGMERFVSDVRPGLLDGQAEIQITPAFQKQAKADREALAIALRKAWHTAYKNPDPDKARIRLVNAQRRQVGGSRAIGGSVVYVDD